MEPIDPRYVPKLARSVAKWQRQHALTQWAMAAVSGTKYVAPPGLPPLVHKSTAIKVNTETGDAFRIPSEETLSSYRPLVEYYAKTLESAKCVHFSKKLSNLAIRTVMPKYKLTLDALRVGQDGGVVPWGFIVWSLPISRAENTGLMQQMVEFRAGELTYPEMPTFSPYEDADLPVVAASWRYEPEANVVWVAFYTQPADQARVMEQLGELTPEQLEEFKRLREPLSLEREQALPLGRSLNWCDADPADGPRLEMTAGADPDDYDIPAVRERAVRNNDAARVLVSEMTRTLIASWMIMKWKVATREEIPPTQDVIRKLAKESGRSKKSVASENGTTVVRLGAPIHKRAAKSTTTKDYTWKVRALVGPVVRDRQYIPAWDTYDEEPRFIEPYWAGPPDAPISNIDRVFTLGDDTAGPDRRSSLIYRALTSMAEGNLSDSPSAAELAQDLGISETEAEKVRTDLRKSDSQIIADATVRKKGEA